LGVEGIGVRDGQEMLIADTPEAFAIAVLRLLADAAGSRALRQQLGAQGRRFVELHYGWESIIPKLEDILVAAAQ
jgi:glycosyltransferase involved in cell wall biosynthesis